MLRRNDARQGHDIEIVTGADKETFARAKKGTVQNGRMVCPETGETFSITSIRGDRRVDGKTVYGLRLWENDDLVPRPDDVFQERLYCVRWVETYWVENRQGELVEKIRRHYCSVDDDDLRREDMVLALLKERFSEWQEKGFIPSQKIERGVETSRFQRERGWTHWHHLFNPRQLLMHRELLSTQYNKKELAVYGFLAGSRVNDWDCRLSRLDSSRDMVQQVFSNQAFNTMYNFGTRGLSQINNLWCKDIPDYPIHSRNNIGLDDARTITEYNDFWLTDPPYADAINYHELTDFFLAWYGEKLSNVFPDWYNDTKKVLAIRGSGEDFKRSMVECYANLTKHMPQNGLQLVMFTHQDASVSAILIDIDS